MYKRYLNNIGKLIIKTQYTTEKQDYKEYPDDHLFLDQR